MKQKLPIKGAFLNEMLATATYEGFAMSNGPTRGNKIVVCLNPLLRVSKPRFRCTVAITDSRFLA